MPLAMENSPRIQVLRCLEVKLAAVRETHRGSDSDEQDAILDEMDAAWWALTKPERDYINATTSPNYDALVKWLDGSTT